MAERECPTCHYVLEPLDAACPRCARRVTRPCAVCGRLEVAGECHTCHKPVCAEHLLQLRHVEFCTVCAPAEARGEPAPGAVDVQLDPELPGPGFLPAVSMPGDDGFVGNLRRGWVFMQECLLMAFRDKDLLIPPFLAVLVCTGFIISSLLIMHQLGWWDQYLGGSRQPDLRLALIAVWIIFGCYALAYLFDGMTVHLVDAHLRGRDALLSEALADSLRNLGALLLLAAMSVVVSLLTGRRRRRGLLDLEGVASEAIQHAWTAVVYLVLPIIILEDVSLFRAMARAKEIHARNLVPILVAEVGVLLVGQILGGLAVAAAVGLVYLLASASQAMLPIALIGAGLWLALVVAYTGFLRTAYYTCLYLWAVQRSVSEEAAPVPRPLAVALEA